MILPTKLRRPWSWSLRRRILRCLRQSSLPISTVDLALICAPDVPHAGVHILQQLTLLERRGRVCRVAALPGGGPGRKQPLRWVLAEGGAR